MVISMWALQFPLKINVKIGKIFYSSIFIVNIKLYTL
jgi:hypothetical protein